MINKKFLRDKFGDAFAPNNRYVSDNFIEWFDGSVVSNAKNIPIEVYHGTVVDGVTYNVPDSSLPERAFVEFSLNETGKVSDSSDAKIGFWFSESKERAQDAAADAKTVAGDGSEYIYSVYLSLKKALFLDDIKLIEPAELADIAKNAKDQGYHGIVFSRGEYEKPDYLVFYPSCIKSSKVNSGVFSDSDNSINDILGLRKKDDIVPSRIDEFNSVSKDVFLGKPRISGSSNTAHMKASLLVPLEYATREKFLDSFEAVYCSQGAAVFDKNELIASYEFGNHLFVNKPYRRRGIGTELAYQFRTRFPNVPPASSRTRASQALQEKVWYKIRAELARIELDRAIGIGRARDAISAIEKSRPEKNRRLKP